MFQIMYVTDVRAFRGRSQSRDPLVHFDSARNACVQCIKAIVVTVVMMIVSVTFKKFDLDYVMQAPNVAKFRVEQRKRKSHCLVDFVK